MKPLVYFRYAIKLDVISTFKRTDTQPYTSLCELRWKEKGRKDGPTGVEAEDNRLWYKILSDTRFYRDRILLIQCVQR